MKHLLKVLIGIGLIWASMALATPTTNTLIADTNNHRVIEVAPDKSIIWQYGKTGVNGSGIDQLPDAQFASK